ncbi:MAG: PAS domain-containing protein [Chitinophagaceae bacterium]
MNEANAKPDASESNGIENVQKRIELLKMSQAVNLLGSWEWDLKSDKLLWTDEMFLLRATPVSADNLISIEDNYKFVHQDDRELVRTKFESLKQKQEVEFEYRITTTKGETKTILAWATMFRDENGEPQFIRGTSQDVTRLRKAEKQLKETNHAFEQAEEMANMGNWKWTSKTDTLVFSANLYKMLGCAPGEFEPSFENFLKYVHQDDREKALFEQTALLQQNKSLSSEYRIIRKDGQERFMQSTSKVFTSAEGNILLGTVQDATEEIQLRRLLEEKMYFAEMLIENSVDLIAAYDSDQRLIAWNKTCEERYKLKKQDVMGKHVLDLFPELDGSPCMEDIRRALQGELRYQPELHLTLLDGYFEYFLIPLQKADGEVFGALLFHTT